jgi:hypothetical protein
MKLAPISHLPELINDKHLEMSANRIEAWPRPATERLIDQRSFRDRKIHDEMP